MRSRQLIRRTPNNASAEYCAAGRKAHRTGIKKKHSCGGGGTSRQRVYRGFSRQLNAATAWPERLSCSTKTRLPFCRSAAPRRAAQRRAARLASPMIYCRLWRQARVLDVHWCACKRWKLLPSTITRYVRAQTAAWTKTCYYRTQSHELQCFVKRILSMALYIAVSWPYSKSCLKMKWSYFNILTAIIEQCRFISRRLTTCTASESFSEIFGKCC